MKKKIILIILALVAATALYFGYQAKLAPTKVALINYPDFLQTKVAKSNDNSWIKVEAFKPNDLPNLESYDQLLVFGMGIDLPASEEAKIAAARDAGVSVFIHIATKPRLEQLGNMHGKTFDNITDYMGNGGTENYRNMLNFIRREIDGKTAFTDTVVLPKKIPSEVLFYKEESAVFETVEAFEKYTKANKLYIPNAPKVVVFTSIPGPFNANREHLNSLISEFESRQMNVYPIAASGGRIAYMNKIKPDLIVYLPHGRLGRGDKMVKALQAHNVPMLCPLSVFQEHDKWLKDKQGMSGGLLSQSVTMPELDGSIVSYAVFAQYKDENGFLLFQAIPNRLKKFGALAEKYIALKHKANKDKKIAIVYFKGPGKNALVAANMEVLPSMHNMLLRLQKEGYNLGNLPQDYERFEKDIYRQGPVLGPYAEGAFDKLLQEGDPELIDVDTYNQWRQDLLPQELIDRVDTRYGKAPGSYMAVTKQSKDYLAVARVQYGNVVLLPQPLPAIGDNEFQLIHGAKVAPPHTYIAPYLWAQKGFEADAIFHFGTHGSLEFLPGKQIALSSYDWTDPLIGTTPHFYIYTISNVGEGMIAKRRSYAVTQTYLTPPFIEAQALGEQKSIHAKIHRYEQMPEGALKTEYALSIKKLAVEQQLHKDLGLDSILDKPYSEEEMMKLSNYLEEIDHEKITGGLYTMAVPYTPAKVDETVLMMMVNSLSYNLAEIDIQKGLYPRKKMEDKLFFNGKYTHPAESYIQKVIKKQSSANNMFKRIVSEQDRQRALAWKAQNGGGRKSDMMAAMMSMKAKTQSNDSVATDAEKQQLKALIIKILPQQEKIDYVKRIESDKEYKRVIAMLDPQTRRKIKPMAKMIPAMAKALKISQDETVTAIVKLVQKPELRQLALAYIKDENLEEAAAAEKEKLNKALVAQALSDDNYRIVSLKNVVVEYKDIDTYKTLLDFYIEHAKTLPALLSAEKQNTKAQTLAAFLQNDYAEVKKAIQQQIKALETREMLFSQAVFQVEKTLNDILIKHTALQQSPEKELQAVLNSLEGGYTAPTSGGDPITNPATLPTGRNLFAIDAEKTPSRESWKVAQKLTDALLDDYRAKHEGAYPEKISFTLWSSSFIETEGTTVGQILCFLGVEPVWDVFGRVSDVRVIPLKDLGRPRIDVVVQTSGQLRDLAASRLFLINRAIAKVAALDEEENFVGKGVRDAEEALVSKGFSPKRARELAQKRVFGGVNGNYGAAIMGMVESSDRWDSTRAVAQTYINNMGAVYGDADDWGEFEKGVFEAALLNTQVVVQPRQSNTWGALSLDHVYEFMGGINLAIREVTGNDAESYFNDFRNASNPRVQGLKEAIWVESRTTLFNPRYIKELTKGGASSAETFAETFRNTFGWNVMKPSVIENRLWDELYNVYVQDKLQLDLHQFFKRENPYALQEMTAVMLETVRKGMWKATPEQIKAMANLHAELVKEHEAGCSGFVCDNMKLKSFIGKQLDEQLKKDYEQEIEKVREAPKREGKDAVVLKKEQQDKVQVQNTKPSFLQNTTVWISLGAVLLLLIIAAVVLRKKRK